MEKVSVIMSVYNGRPFIDRSVNSIVNQSFSSFEFLIMDDGSIDGSLDLLRVWAEKDARIKVFTQKNEGLNSALNFLIEKSKGLYIARMDVDDFSFPERLAQQVDYLNNHPSIDLVSTGAVHVDGEGSGFSAVIYPDSDDYYRKSILEDRFNPVYHGAAMYRRSGIEQFIPLVYRLRYGQDYDLWFRMIASGSRFGTVQQVLYGYNWGSELQLNYEKNMCRVLQKKEIQRIHKEGMLCNDAYCSAELSKCKDMRVTMTGQKIFDSECVIANFKRMVVRGRGSDVYLLFRSHFSGLSLRQKALVCVIVCAAWLPKPIFRIFHDLMINRRNLKHEGQWCRWNELLRLDYHVVWNGRVPD